MNIYAAMKNCGFGNAEVNSVANSAVNFVAVGAGTNRIVYSADGIIWIASANGNSVFGSQGYSVCWNGSKFVAVGRGTNTIAYSTDGVTWTASENGNDMFGTHYGRSVCWNGSKFVAVGSGTYKVAYSVDGITWTASANGNAVMTHNGNTVCWNGSKFVAGSYSVNPLAYSTDGITWTHSENGNSIFSQGEFNSNGGSVQGVCWNGSKFVAVGIGTNRIAYSADGITWTASANGNSILTTMGTGVCWNGSKFVAVGSGTNSIAYSTDGITWTASANGNMVVGVATSVCSANAPNLYPPISNYRVVTFDLDGGTLAGGNLVQTISLGQNATAPYCYKTSHIFTGWSLPITNITETQTITAVWEAVTVNFVAAGSGSGGITYSADGITWAPAATRIFPMACGVCWNGIMFVAVGGGSHCVARSYDGITWVPSNTGIAGVFWPSVSGICWSGSKFVAVGPGSPGMAYSTDGIHWTAAANKIFYSGVAVCWNGDVFVAVGSAPNPIAYSADGITWTASANGNSIFSTCHDVCWNGSKFVAVGTGYNTIAYSTDGITWTASANGTSMLTDSGMAVCWNGSIFVAVGHGDLRISYPPFPNSIAYSADGITWTAANAGGYYHGVCWNGTTFVATGGNGAIGAVYSADGITWVATNGGAGYNDVCSINAPNLCPPVYGHAVYAVSLVSNYGSKLSGYYFLADTQYNGYDQFISEVTEGHSTGTRLIRRWTSTEWHAECSYEIYVGDNFAGVLYIIWTAECTAESTEVPLTGWVQTGYRGGNPPPPGYTVEDPATFTITKLQPQLL